MVKEVDKQPVRLDDMFKDVMQKAEDYQEEMERLYKIENRIRNGMKKAQDELRGLEKAVSFSSISYEARQLIEGSIAEKKLEINACCGLLGEKKLFDLK